MPAFFKNAGIGLRYQKPQPQMKDQYFLFLAASDFFFLFTLGFS